MKTQMVAPLSPVLAERAYDLVGRLRSGGVTAREREQLGDLICDMTEATMRHFFMRPAEELGLGLAARGAIELGVRSTVKTTRMALKQILPRLDDAQMKQVADYLEEALHPSKPGRKSA